MEFEEELYPILDYEFLIWYIEQEIIEQYNEEIRLNK